MEWLQLEFDPVRDAETEILAAITKKEKVSWVEEDECSYMKNGYMHPARR